jgi:hypothetical protein
MAVSADDLLWTRHTGERREFGGYVADHPARDHDSGGSRGALPESQSGENDDRRRRRRADRGADEQHRPTTRGGP